MPHIHEKIDFVADVFIVNKNKVLLRKHDKYKIWLSVGGRIELNEDPMQAAIREAKEEVGLEVTLVDTHPPLVTFTGSHSLIPPAFLNRHFVSDTHEHISFIYFGTSTTGVVHQGETEISDEIKWFTDSELDDSSFGISERIRYYAHAALSALST